VRRQNDKREERMIFMGIKPTSTGLTLQDREGYKDIDMFKREERNRKRRK